jgi:NAD(P)-dependent dehydrogenase (short-subunit alcohol dehydrogenase family)
MSKVILITGISSGFGRQTARLLAEQGHTVYGTIRKECEISDGINVLKMDLMDHGSIRKAVETVIEKEGRIDVLINNAGMHTGGPIETTPFENIELQMGTNFMGTISITKAVLPVMRSQGGGTIINFSSIGGLMGLPFQAFYSAGKFAIEGFTEALRMEVRMFNIKVVVINPGDYHTSNSANRRNFLAPVVPDDPYRKQFEETLSVIEKDEAAGWDPKIIAIKIAKIIGTRNPRQRYIIASYEQKLALKLKYLLPGKWFMKILGDHYKIR